MINLFDKRLKDLEAEVEALKTASFFGTTALSTTTKTAQVAMELEYYTTGIGGVNEFTQSTQIAFIEIVTSSTSGFLSSIELVSGQSQVKNRRCFLAPTMSNGHKVYRFEVVEGSQSDYSILRNGGTVRFNLTFRVACSSDFSLNVTYRTNPHA